MVGLCLLSSVVWANDTKPDLVQVALKKAWVPVGFDDNDQAQIVVMGIFPNTCFQTGPYRVTQTDRGLEISQMAYVYKAKCLQMSVPFTNVIELGLVRAAKQNIIDTKSEKPIAEILVTQAKDAAVDDFMYAPVSEAFILKENGASVLHMVGNLPSKSIRIKEIKVSPFPDVVVVQPIVEAVPGLQPIWELVSEFAPRPHFHVKKALTDLPKGVYLLHIRTMNGKAINQLQNMGVPNE